MSPEVDYNELTKDELIDIVCESTASPNDTPSFVADKRSFVRTVRVENLLDLKVVMGYKSQQDDISRVLAVLQLEPSVYEPLVKKYVKEGTDAIPTCPHRRMEQASYWDV